MNTNTRQDNTAPIPDAVGDVVPKATSNVMVITPEAEAAIRALKGDVDVQKIVRDSMRDDSADKAFADLMMNAGAQKGSVDGITIIEPPIDGSVKKVTVPQPKQRARLSQAVKIIDAIDVIEIDGIRYSRGFFDMMNSRPIGSIFRTTHRDPKTKAVTFEELPPSLKR